MQAFTAYDFGRITGMGYIRRNRVPLLRPRAVVFCKLVDVSGSAVGVSVRQKSDFDVQ